MARPGSLAAACRGQLKSLQASDYPLSYGHTSRYTPTAPRSPLLYASRHLSRYLVLSTGDTCAYYAPPGAGATAIFTLDCGRDERGVAHSGGLAFLPSVRGPSSAAASVRQLPSGKYEISVTPSLSGEYFVSATLDGQSLPTAPCRLLVHTPRAHWEYCEVLAASVGAWLFRGHHRCT